MSILSMYVQSEARRNFQWRIIAVLAQTSTVLMFVDVTGAPKTPAEKHGYSLQFQSRGQ